jgi:hypothetical protein
VRVGRFPELDDCLYHDQNAPARRAVLDHPPLSVFVPKDWAFTLDSVEPEDDLRPPSPVEQISFYSLPMPIFDPRSSSFKPFPGDLAEFLLRHPYLRIDSVRHARFGGIHALEVAGVPTRADPKAVEMEICGRTLDAGPPCVPLAGKVNSENSVPLSLYPGEPFCLIDLPTAQGRALLHVSGSGKPSSLCNAAHVILQTLRVR